MKELPPDPKPWTPPPERWCDRHRHKDGTPPERTIIAMRLTVFYGLGIVAVGNFKIPRPMRELFDLCLRRYGNDIMMVWRERCSGLTPRHDVNADQIFLQMLADLAKERGVTR